MLNHFIYLNLQSEINY
ncbi:hypothetical protein D047_2055B, partial [Vibrio parahaemolyticus VPTS-2010_2]